MCPLATLWLWLLSGNASIFIKYKYSIDSIGKALHKNSILAHVLSMDGRFPSLSISNHLPFKVTDFEPLISDINSDGSKSLNVFQVLSASILATLNQLYSSHKYISINFIPVSFNSPSGPLKRRGYLDIFMHIESSATILPME